MGTFSSYRQLYLSSFSDTHTHTHTHTHTGVQISLHFSNCLLPSPRHGADLHQLFSRPAKLPGSVLGQGFKTLRRTTCIDQLTTSTADQEVSVLSSEPQSMSSSIWIVFEGCYAISRKMNIERAERERERERERDLMKITRTR